MARFNMKVENILSSFIKNSDCNNDLQNEVVQNQMIELWKETTHNNTNNYIIGIKDGIAKIQLPNNIENRIHIASMGYDIISLPKTEAKRLWMSTVLILTKKLELTEISNEIKQVKI